jgi:predicted hydrocarbon binding protein
VSTPHPQVRLKGNLFARPGYFTTDVAKGATRTPSGTRICTLTDDFLLGFRDALIYECGKSFRPVMRSCGKRWGSAFMDRFEKELAAAYQTSMKDLPAGIVHTCLIDAFNYHGWGRLSIDLSAADSGVIEILLSDSVMPTIVRESDLPVDHLICGLLAAVFSRFADTELGCVQTECPSRGAAASRFLILSLARSLEIEEWIAQVSDSVPLSHEAIVRHITQPAPELFVEKSIRNGVGHSPEYSS